MGIIDGVELWRTTIELKLVQRNRIDGLRSKGLKIDYKSFVREAVDEKLTHMENVLLRVERGEK